MGGWALEVPLGCCFCCSSNFLVMTPLKSLTALKAPCRSRLFQRSAVPPSRSHVASEHNPVLDSLALTQGHVAVTFPRSLKYPNSRKLSLYLIKKHKELLIVMSSSRLSLSNVSRTPTKRCQLKSLGTGLDLKFERRRFRSGDGSCSR